MTWREKLFSRLMYPSREESEEMHKKFLEEMYCKPSGPYMDKHDEAYQFLRLINTRQSRCLGKTTALAKLCKERDGIMLCATENEAARVRRDFGIHATTMFQGLFVGSPKPIIPDHNYVEELLSSIIHEPYPRSKEIEKLKLEVETLKNEASIRTVEIKDVCEKNLQLERERDLYLKTSGFTCEKCGSRSVRHSSIGRKEFLYCHKCGWGQARIDLQRGEHEMKEIFDRMES